MENPFRQLEHIVKSRHIDPEGLVHALMATVYTNCCDDCVNALRSEDFMEAFDHMAGEMNFCAQLANRGSFQSRK